MVFEFFLPLLYWHCIFGLKLLKDRYFVLIVHPSIHFLSLGRCSSRLSKVSRTSLFLGIPWQDGIYNPSSMFQLCPGVSSQLDVSIHSLDVSNWEASRRHPNHMFECLSQKHYK